MTAKNPCGYRWEATTMRPTTAIPIANTTTCPRAKSFCIAPTKGMCSHFGSSRCVLIFRAVRITTRIPKVNIARTAGFLHDVGKALTHEVEGPHAEIGADLVAKYGMPDDIQKAIREHHDREMTTVESFVVAAADAISAARPGARRDTVEHYIQRLEALENVARGFSGVERCFAIQAGREIRVMVKPEEIDDSRAAVLARDIVKRIEETLAYPGQIKVVVIRESRTVEFAR